MFFIESIWAWGKSGNVISVEWQVTLYDPTWPTWVPVAVRPGGISLANRYTSFTYLLCILCTAAEDRQARSIWASTGRNDAPSVAVCTERSSRIANISDSSSSCSTETSTSVRPRHAVIAHLHYTLKSRPLAKLASTKDRGRTDRTIMSIRARLRHCRWPHASPH